jgi:LmbE family N-acetylglucosaminyl deacetylase
MRWIYISPHFDDAVLSCGGLIWEQSSKGLPVEIWTVCAGDPPPGLPSTQAAAIHQIWGFTSAEQAVASRRVENQHTAAILGAEIVEFSIPDCIYRRSASGELLYPEDVFVPTHAVEKDLAADIALALDSELQPEDVIVCPLAIGGHIDHYLVRLAVERLTLPIRYYSDIPYLLNNPEHLVPSTLGLNNAPHPISAKGLEAWQKSIAAYSSQILMLFGSLEAMQAAIQKYWEEQQGLFLWSVS